MLEVNQMTESNRSFKPEMWQAQGANDMVADVAQVEIDH